MTLQNWFKSPSRFSTDRSKAVPHLQFLCSCVGGFIICGVRFVIVYSLSLLLFVPRKGFAYWLWRFLSNSLKQSPLYTQTFDTTTQFVIMTIWMSRNVRSRDDGLWEIMQKHCIISSSNICFWIFVRIASERRFLQISKIYVLWGNKNKTRSFLHIILSNKDSLEQQIHYNGNIFGNKRVHCNFCYDRMQCVAICL